MRKYIRAMMRAEAERRSIKASRFIKVAWNKYQIKKIGSFARLVNRAKGTAPKYKWKNRIASVL